MHHLMGTWMDAAVGMPWVIIAGDASRVRADHDTPAQVPPVVASAWPAHGPLWSGS